MSVYASTRIPALNGSLKCFLMMARSDEVGFEIPASEPAVSPCIVLASESPVRIGAGALGSRFQGELGPVARNFKSLS